MGDRRNIIVKGEGMSLAFYTHWTGSNSINDIAIALDLGRSRWDDFGYFARVMFSVMTRHFPDVITGFGIYPVVNGQSPMESTPGYDPIVDLDSQTVTVEGKSYSFDSVIDAYFDKVQAVPV